MFRYPVTKTGSASLTVNESIDIRNFSDVANRVFWLLDACACGFSEYLQSKWESQREYRDYYG